MKKVALLALVASLAVSTYAWAAGPISRPGIEYSGLRNPNGCEVFNDGGDLHVKCMPRKGATGPAFVRYRFLKDVGGVRDLATVSADITTWIGAPCTVRWMVPAPRTAARTLRVTVPLGSYCHVHSVSWEQG